MKVIANGGASTKNVANNTLDAIYLGLNAPYIDGFKFNFLQFSLFFFLIYTFLFFWKFID